MGFSALSIVFFACGYKHNINTHIGISQFFHRIRMRLCDKRKQRRKASRFAAAQQVSPQTEEPSPSPSLSAPGPRVSLVQLIELLYPQYLIQTPLPAPDPLLK